MGTEFVASRKRESTCSNELRWFTNDLSLHFGLGTAEVDMSLSA